MAESAQNVSIATTRRRRHDAVRARRVASLPMFVALLALAAAACSGDDDDTDTTEIPVLDDDTDLVGTCLAFPADVGAEISALPSVACSESHSHEIFAVVESQQATYPGFEALEAEAQVACLGEFEPYVGTNPFDSELFYEWIVPTLDSWDRSDDREIICVAANHNGAPLTASVRDSKR